jgi:hypothetical protein
MEGICSDWLSLSEFGTETTLNGVAAVNARHHRGLAAFARPELVFHRIGKDTLSQPFMTQQKQACQSTKDLIFGGADRSPDRDLDTQRQVTAPQGEQIPPPEPLSMGSIPSDSNAPIPLRPLTSDTSGCTNLIALVRHCPKTLLHINFQAFKECPAPPEKRFGQIMSYTSRRTLVDKPNLRLGEVVMEGLV